MSYVYTVIISLLASTAALRSCNTPLEQQTQNPERAESIFTAQVTYVHDGDTISVTSPGQAKPLKLRLWGVDAPELNQPYGRMARKSLQGSILGKKVSVRVHEKDRYGRLVAELQIDKHDIGTSLIKQGFAWWYQRHAQDARHLATAQTSAQREHRGMWKDSGNIAPWEWRARYHRS
jgi:micrococcal nuclease